METIENKAGSLTYATKLVTVHLHGSFEWFICYPNTGKKGLQKFFRRDVLVKPESSRIVNAKKTCTGPQSINKPHTGYLCKSC